ncbi:AAA family ATPase [Faecalispora jeddahensis]|uniref:AAA family ATPase n=1 Tax=Faecalispora jeddahensis TaxID=1414721 RepID=UPI0027B9BEE2|nr:AAA family ATPase [Faecalispora jeddahensis]
MSLYMIYTYNTIEQLRQIQSEKKVIPFIFVETKDELEDNPHICIDISTLIYLLRTNKDNKYSAYINLREMTDETIIIVEESLADDVINFFPHLFSAYTPFFPKEDIQNKETSPVAFKNTRQTIYTYNNVDDLTTIISYANTHNIPITTFSRASGDLKSELEKFNKSEKLTLLDLTSTAYAIEDNKNLIYTIELFISAFPNVKIIILTSQVDKIINYFPLYIEDHKPINILLPDLEELTPIDDSADEVKKITSLSILEFNSFIKGFNHNLIGHDYFKERFKYCLKNFTALNKVKEQKVFSIFLFGASGIGKTEVARLIANGLLEDSYLAKINFQNYSSQDALNSLIGSPAGYIGCEHGELSEKVKKSKVGIVLCDEFEKTTRPVFSFFLELLEDGKFTDSMTREYDLNGYILVFTSNLPNEAEYKKIIPPELQTRFDLVCEFQEPSYYDKTKFLDLLLEQAESKFSEQLSQIQMTPEEKQKLYDFDYSNINALRDIKRVFYNRLMDFISSKQI